MSAHFTTMILYYNTVIRHFPINVAQIARGVASPPTPYDNYFINIGKSAAVPQQRYAKLSSPHTAERWICYDGSSAASNSSEGSKPPTPRKLGMQLFT
jgi:hypothetical protein